MGFNNHRNIVDEKKKSDSKEYEDELNEMNSQIRLAGFQENCAQVSMGYVDPLAVNKLLSQELNQLSLDLREHILEEVHGVMSDSAVSLRTDTDANIPFPGQNEEEIALREFQEELDRLYFSETTQVETNSFTAGRRNSTMYPSYRYARDNGSELIKDRNFQLKFFGRGEEGRCPKKSAKRMLNYLDFVRHIYHTDDVLFRPITLMDLNEAIGSKTFMYDVAPLQILPLRDPSGRRVVVNVRNFGPASCRVRIRQQVGMYFAQIMSEDRDGIVFVYFMHHNHKCGYNAQEFQAVQKMMEIIPPKLSAVHLCFPEGRLYDIAKAGVMLLMGKENRLRLRLHVGSYQECKYALRSFGIPVDRLPVDWESKGKHSKKKHLDLKNHRKWLSMREAKEAAMFAAVGRDSRGRVVKADSYGIGSSYNGVMAAVQEIRSNFVECPRHEDCLFGKGRPAMYHPGNIAMRRLLDAKIHRFEAMASLQKSVVVWEVVNRIKRGTGRFLKEDAEHAGLYVLSDDETAFKKIAIAFRDLKKRRLRGGEQKDVVGKSMQQSLLQDKGQMDLWSTEARGRERPATRESSMLGIPSDGFSSVASNLDVDINMDMAMCDEVQLCLFPPNVGDEDAVSKQRKCMKNQGL